MKAFWPVIAGRVNQNTKTIHYRTKKQQPTRRWWPQTEFRSDYSKKPPDEITLILKSCAAKILMPEEKVWITVSVFCSLLFTCLSSGSYII